MKTKRNMFQLCLLGAVLLLPAVGQAQFTFTTNNGAITITGYTGTNSIVVIPAITNGFPIVSIAGSAFSYSTLTSVIIPDSVTNIGSKAFAECATLTSLIISNSVVSIGANSFTDCLSLTNVSLGINVPSIGDLAFSGCSSLTSINVPNSVINIGQWAFAFCDNLSVITVATNNPSYSSLDGVLFNKSQTMLIKYPEGKSGNYSIPSGVTIIDDFGIYACTSLTSIFIPITVTNIYGNGYIFDTFSYCSSLKAITVDEQNPVYSSRDGVLFDKSITTLINYPQGRTEAFYTIPDSVTSIDPNNFHFCINLTNLIIGDNVTNIGAEAIISCPNLTSVTLGKDVTYIGDDVGTGCGNLTTIFVRGDAPTNIGWDVFLGDTNATIYYLPGSVGWSTDSWYPPTALWIPQIDTSGGSFGVQTNQFGFNIQWASGETVVVEACTNLSNPVWQPVQTNTLTGGAAYFSDPQWTNYPGRYYRLRSP
jgi:hypothetical protein